MVDNSRRRFVGICSLAPMLCGTRLGAAALAERFLPFERVLLIDAAGRPLNCDALQIGQEYVFFYPYASTPCFLLNLGKPTAETVELHTDDGRSYQWFGGIGPERSIVAFSAICSHRLTHPSAVVSFIGYRQESVRFVTGDNRISRRGGVIQCCSEQSIYDPVQGAKVLAGPAPQPLAAIVLQEKQSLLYATGVCGGILFEQFFDRFGFRLALEVGEARVRQRVTDTAMVQPIEAYTRQQIRC